MSSIGIDAGTSVVKAVVFDDDWLPLATAERAVAVHHPQPGWSEQDPDAVWRAVTEVVREVAAAAPDDIDYLAVTAQGDGCWLVDAAGEPLRPAMLWNDARAAEQVQRWEDAGLLLEAFRRNGSYGFAGLAHAQLAWLGEHEPQELSRASDLLSCGSLIYLRLTGRRVLDVSEACNPFLAADGSGYDDELLTALELSWCRPLLPEVVSGEQRVGWLDGDVAERLGLRAATPTVLAPYDVVTTAIGLAAMTPTAAMTVLGTTLAVGVVSPDAAVDREPAGMALDMGLSGRWMLLYATLAGTEVLEWARQLLGVADAAALVQLALSQPADERTPLVLPYLSPAGERAPFRDARARGAVLGLELGHGPAHVARGVLEGLTLTVADCIAASGRSPQRLALSGGGARSDGWCQLLADACALPVERGHAAQVGALGAALVAAVAVGRYPDIDTASAAAVRPGQRFEPRAEQVRRLARSAERFRAAREHGAHRT